MGSEEKGLRVKKRLALAMGLPKEAVTPGKRQGQLTPEQHRVLAGILVMSAGEASQVFKEVARKKARVAAGKEAGPVVLPKPRPRVRRRWEPPPPPNISDIGDLLRQLGHSSYTEYRKTPMYKAIKRKVFAKFDRRCVDCRKPGSQVHHQRYTLANLGGWSLKHLVLICRECHKKRHQITP